MSAMDGLEERAAPARPTLDYPFAAPPADGGTMEVAPGIVWVRMPLPFALRWINLWLIEDGPGWTLVDTGIQSDETREYWARIFAGTLKGKPITRLICTHMHPDHLGLAGWMTRKFQCPLWITRLEYLMCRHLVADTGREAPEDGVRFYREAGWSESDLDSYRVHFGGFGKAIHALPDSYRRIVDGETIAIGGRIWRVIVGSGHSPEHACLHQPDLNILISGDQLLPRISSNVSVFPTEPDADPLSEWLSSCAKLKAATPDDVLVLPAHNEPFRGAHLRLDNLIADHEHGLRRLEDLLAREPRRAIDVFGALFSRAIGPDLLSMATGESLAHLNCLRARGRAARRVNNEGIAWYGPR